MKPDGGYLFIIDEPARASFIKDYVDADSEFTDVVSAPDWRVGKSAVFLVSLDGEELLFAALARRSRRAATYKDTLRFSNFVVFDPPIQFNEIPQKLDPRFRHHFTRLSSGRGSRVPPKTWENLLAALKQLRPSSADGLDQLEHLRQLRHKIAGRPGIEIVTQERDAVNLALRMSQLDERGILNWHPPDRQMAPFLQGLEQFTPSEDQMIAHDVEVFGDWKRLRPDMTGVVKFCKNGERLIVMNVNRHPIEETLGVDLLYYHHRYRSYVMVQYKRMIRETNTPLYRPIDKSYKAELERMQIFRQQIVGIERSFSNLTDYRLNPGLFYFKLCPTIGFDPTSTEMIKGLYIPLDYWELLLNSPSIIGPLGGQRITYENTERHFSNSLFIQLVQDGWIGSPVAHESIISDIIQEALSTGRSVNLAAKLPIQKNSEKLE